MASKDITFCNNRKCPHKDCLRYYDNAPFDVPCSWFHVNPDEKNGKCKEYLSYKKESK